MPCSLVPLRRSPGRTGMGCASALDAGAGGAPGGPCGVGPGGPDAARPGATAATGATGADGLGGGGAEDFFAKPLAPRSTGILCVQRGQMHQVHWKMM